MRATGDGQGAAPEAGRTMVEVIGRRAARHPDRVAFTFLADGEAVAGTLSFGDLAARAARAGAALRDRGVAGGRVLLIHPQGLDFVLAFLATLAAGAAAVPAPSAAPGRANRARLLAIAGDSRPTLAVTTPAFLDEARSLFGGLPVTTLEALEAERPDGPGPSPPDPGQVALVQYTSGSTGAPKGVVVTHAAILANQALIQDRFEHSDATVTIGWLPMFHDMGLIGNMLQPIYTGTHCVLMPPGAFLAEPARWLRAIQRFGGTTAGAPNFAYDLCVERVTPAQRDGLDLSTWTIAYNGSEPVRAGTLDRFAASFAPHGFRPETFYPCYGMAEATLFISGLDKAARPRVILAADGRRLVGSGRTGPGHEIVAVDPATRNPLPDGEEGELWFRGGSVAQGYWERPEESARTFGAVAEGRGGGWLRTGDLGVMDQGEVFVTGRIKDVMIVRGRNHYPQDIEATVQAAHPGLRIDGGAAFLVEAGERSSLVVVQELRRAVLREPPVEEIARAVRAAVVRDHGLQVAALVLLRPGGLPRTSSGKVRRRACREGFLAGTLAVAGQSLMGYAPPPPAPPGAAPPALTLIDLLSSPADPSGAAPRPVAALPSEGPIP